jgi:HEAT repeat protein
MKYGGPTSQAYRRRRNKESRIGAVQVKQLKKILEVCEAATDGPLDLSGEYITYDSYNTNDLEGKTWTAEFACPDDAAAFALSRTALPALAKFAIEVLDAHQNIHPDIEALDEVASALGKLDDSLEDLDK